jgi:phosphopantothenoylcysteine decarboxylase/phosphopantothenate--cysteine ligase
MGYAIAEAALDAGHDVILISGPVNLAPPSNAKLVSVSTSDEMFDAVHRHADKCDVCVLCAAVADYKPANVLPTKMKKRRETFSLELIPTRDILDSLGQQRDRRFLLVGFAAETNHVEENAAQKLSEKNCDIMIANDVNSAKSGMETDVNEVTILFRNGERQKISRAQKKIIARELVKIFHNSQQKRLTKKM